MALTMAYSPCSHRFVLAKTAHIGQKGPSCLFCNQQVAGRNPPENSMPDPDHQDDSPDRDLGSCTASPLSLTVPGCPANHTQLLWPPTTCVLPGPSWEDCVVAYRNKVFVSFDGDNDIHYYRLMRAWKQSDKSDFNFFDAHDLNTARDTSTEETIKRRLSARVMHHPSDQFVPVAFAQLFWARTILTAKEKGWQLRYKIISPGPDHHSGSPDRDFVHLQRRRFLLRFRGDDIAWQAQPETRTAAPKDSQCSHISPMIVTRVDAMNIIRTMVKNVSPGPLRPITTSPVLRMIRASWLVALSRSCLLSIWTTKQRRASRGRERTPAHSECRLKPEPPDN